MNLLFHYAEIKEYYYFWHNGRQLIFRIIK